MAEKAAWDYLEGLPDDEKFELSVINPGFVVGPTLITGDFASGRIISEMMMNKMAGIVKLSFPVVDVRDVATAHVNALNEDAAQGKRFLLSADSAWLSDLAKMLGEEFTSHNINTAEANYWLLRFLGLFMSAIAGVLEIWGKESFYNNNQSKEILKIDYKPIKDSLADMGYSLIRNGMVENKGNVSADVLEEKF